MEKIVFIMSSEPFLSLSRYAPARRALRAVLKRITTFRKHVVVLVLPLAAACSPMTPNLNPGNLGAGKAASDGTDTASAAAKPVKAITASLLQEQKAEKDARSNAGVMQLMARSAPYKIEQGDILSVIVWDHPELSGSVLPGRTAYAPGYESTNPNQMPSATFTVGHDGAIQFPYVGMLKIAGMTEDEARDLLTARLAHYINKPNVTLSIQSYRSKRIYVDGAVKSPGVQAINDIPMTLVEGINRAGGFLPTADQSQILLNRAGKTFHINLPNLVKTGIDPAEVMLANGDVVSVLSREQSKVFISGEVIAPRSLLMHNGKLSLNEALGEAGGINPSSGDVRQVYVIRRFADDSTVYRLDAQTPDAMALAEGFELYPKDIVYVAPTALTNWHRTISQMLPGALNAVVTSAIPPR